MLQCATVLVSHGALLIKWLPWRVLHSTRGYCGSPVLRMGTAGYCRVLLGTAGTVDESGYCGSTRGYCRVLWVLRVLHGVKVAVGYCGSTGGYCRVLWVLRVLYNLGTAGTAGMICRVLQGTAEPTKTTELECRT